MKKIYVQRQIIGWEEFTYEVDDNFQDYGKLVYQNDWTDWEYMPDASDYTGEYEIYDENYNKIEYD